MSQCQQGVSSEACGEVGQCSDKVRFPEAVGVRLVAWLKGNILTSWPWLSPSGPLCCILWGTFHAHMRGKHPYWHRKSPGGVHKCHLWQFLKGLFSCHHDPCWAKHMLNTCGGPVRLGGSAAAVLFLALFSTRLANILIVWGLQLPQSC